MPIYIESRPHGQCPWHFVAVFKADNDPENIAVLIKQGSLNF